MITVKELIAILKTVNQDAKVLMSSDAEGNETHALSIVIFGKIATDNGRDIEYNQCSKGHENCVVLFPE